MLQRLIPVQCLLVRSFVALVVPNLVFMGGAFFTLAAVTRSMLATYMGVVGTLVVFGMSRALMGDLPGHTLSAILDPFGISTLRVQTRY